MSPGRREPDRPGPPGAGGATYRDAGVDLDAADEAVGRIAAHARRASRPEVVGDLGGFAGMLRLDPSRWREPLLVTATDGVGTKLEVARATGRHRGVGVDLVAMVVDDLVVSGAEPMAFLDYLAVGRLDADLVDELVAGVADGCELAGCALVGGETAEHPGVVPDEHYDLAGFGVGLVERDDLLGAHLVEPGDAVVAIASSGLHANGYSLARAIVDGLDLDGAHGLTAPSLGAALMEPTRIYAPDCLRLRDEVEVHALCHVTGGGVPGNLPRVLPDGAAARVDAATFEPPEIIGWLVARGRVAFEERWRVLNMGAGMLVVTPQPEAAVGVLADLGHRAWVCGRVEQRDGHGPQVVLDGADGLEP